MISTSKYKVGDKVVVDLGSKFMHAIVNACVARVVDSPKQQHLVIKLESIVKNTVGTQMYEYLRVNPNISIEERQVIGYVK